MTEPSHLEDGTAFDAVEIARALRGEAAFARDGHAARTLVRQPDLRVVLVAVSAGSVIKQHRARETASIHLLEGRIRLALGTAQEVGLAPGQLLALAPGLRHDVQALEESAFILTLGWHAPNE